MVGAPLHVRKHPTAHSREHCCPNCLRVEHILGGIDGGHRQIWEAVTKQHSD